MRAARYDADISVVRLSSYLTLSPMIQQARLIPQGERVPDGSPVVHAGWGVTAVSCIFEIIYYHLMVTDCR